MHNASVWHGREGGPILVVCYTNHALDQFLEGIHAFHPEGIVRVGGRSNSETIQECSLAKIKQTRREVTENHMYKILSEQTLHWQFNDGTNSLATFSGKVEGRP